MRINNLNPTFHFGKKIDDDSIEPPIQKNKKSKQQISTWFQIIQKRWSHSSSLPLWNKVNNGQPKMQQSQVKSLALERQQLHYQSIKLDSVHLINFPLY
jgi:hypothetical protein